MFISYLGTLVPPNFTFKQPNQRDARKARKIQKHKMNFIKETKHNCPQKTYVS